MVDFAGINGGLQLLQEEIDGGEVPALGTGGDLSQWPAAMAAMQAAIKNSEQASADTAIDYAELPGAILNLEQQIPNINPDQVLFNGDPVIFNGDPVIFTT